MMVGVPKAAGEKAPMALMMSPEEGQSTACDEDNDELTWSDVRLIPVMLEQHDTFIV